MDGQFKVTIDQCGRMTWEGQNFTGHSCKESAAFLRRVVEGANQVTEDKPELYAEEQESMVQTI